MSNADDRLRALFEADLPPARDLAFAAQVSEALARRVLLADLAWLGVLSLLGAVVLWWSWPHVSVIVEALAVGLAPVVVVSSLALLLVGAVSGRVWAPRI